MRILGFSSRIEKDKKLLWVVDVLVKEKNEWWEWMKALLIAVGLAAIIRYFLFAPIVVDGLSMMPTLHNRRSNDCE